MASWWAVVRRTAFALLALWLVVTGAFVLLATTDDPNEALVRQAAAMEVADGTMDEDEVEVHVEQAVEAYREQRGYDLPLHERYFEWLSGIATFQWGLSESTGQPVTDVLGERLAVTATYVFPGLALALVGGVALGTYGALGRNQLLSRLSIIATYTIYGVPNFWIAAVALAIVPLQFGIVLTGYDLERSLVSSYNLQRVALPALILGTGLIAGQAQHVRAELLERESRPYVRTARAGGLSEWRVSYHVLRVAAVPLLSLTLSKLFGVLLVNVFVLEYVFELPGFGLVTYNAILRRDLPLVMGATLIIAIVGIVATYVQDLAAGALDPRVDLE
ncbi:ABC transporter permease [Salinadaptatus halalkaliphilus]|uniref:ABC transporter permease n=1 Tax=Salinadaptatus halalkaliphilus TaxID=2419781 RepID=A0A4V3VKZ0_9EURY|nr:ABC transporter permease [Salinadaptatus halalkaliphilus]THE63607.1 ABC transporter permease [Salinadaptatus halalkaliphilus]